MLNVKGIKIEDIYSSDFLYISFEIDDTTESLSNYQINLMRSLSAQGPYSVIAYGITNFRYTDRFVNLSDPSIKYFYKIQIVDENTREVYVSDYQQFLQGKPDDFSFAIREIESLYLHNVINNDSMYLLNKMRTGQRCNCYDSIRKQADPQCLSCFGTGYVGGYYEPTEIKVNFFTPISEEGVYIPSDDFNKTAPIQLWTSNFPVIEAGDILVDNKNRRYIIQNCQRSTKNYFLFRQTVVAHVLPRSNIAYDFLVKEKF